MWYGGRRTKRWRRRSPPYSRRYPSSVVHKDIRFCRIFNSTCLYVFMAVGHNLALICGLIRGPDMGRLTARKVETAKPGKYGDGAGLQLSVAPTGAKKWVLRFLWQ